MSWNQGLQRILLSELPNFMQPRFVLVRDALPRNPNGKLDRPVIIAEALADVARLADRSA